MLRARFALVLALAACGGKSTPVSTVPLPDDQPAATEPVADPKPPAPAEPAEPAPLPPLDVKIPAMSPTVKLVSAGKGKKTPLAYGMKPGATQAVELVMGLDTSFKDDASGKANRSVIPTLVLVGDSEVTAVGADGAATYKFTVTKVSARDVPDEEITVDQFQQMVGTTMTGMQMTGSVAANGALGETTLHVEKPDMATQGALGLVQVAMPRWPVLPKEAVGVGAKWTVTWQSALQEQILVSFTTDYELTARKGTTWTVKSKTQVSGADQTIGPSAISKIGGTGTATATATDGVLFPVSTAALETLFTASQNGQSLVVDYKMTGSFGPVTPAAVTPAAPAPTK